MKWNWQQKDWPHFTYHHASIAALEQQFLQSLGFLQGTCQLIGEKDRINLLVEILSSEAVKTAEIEGEILNRESVQASLLRQFGLKVDNRKIPAAEQGIATMMTDLYRNFSIPLTHDVLFNWYKSITNGRHDLKEIGQYRASSDPMQVVSGAIYDPRIHFEAPPSAQLSLEMGRFIEWFNATAPSGPSPLPALTRAAIAHWYFVCIHPFEDGNGRIARALAEKSLAQSVGHPTLIALSYRIEKYKKDYYSILEQSSGSNEISAYLVYFANTVLKAQHYTQNTITFILEKTKFYDRLRGMLNPRQEKALARMFREGIEGFEGGLSADKYIRLTGTSRATATRDLQDLVEKMALNRTGELKNTRYFLNIPLEK